MTTPWRKTIRDFQQESARTLLVVAAMAIGITGFAAVLSAYAVLTRELDKGYLATNPASAVLHTEAIDNAMVAAVLSDRDVSDAEPRRVISASIKTGPVQWRRLVLFVLNDYQNVRLSKVVPDQGAWPPAKGEVLIERDAFRVARARIGDTVIIKLGEKEQTLRVSGEVHDVGQPQARMETTVYGYIAPETLTQLGEQPYFDRLQILVARDRFNEEHIRKVAADVKKLLEEHGHPVHSVDIPVPGKHPHHNLMAALLLAMSSFGLFVLGMSAILVVNLLMAIMAAQVRQIGVMKTIGGTRAQIARIYFGQALLLGLAATAIAIPLGILAGRALGRAYAQFLNFDIASYTVPLWVYVLVFAVGVMVPLLAAAWPIWRGTAISVREALAAFGVSQRTYGTGLLDRAIAHIGGSFRPFLLALRNSFRRRTRLALTLLTLTASGVFFMAALNIRSSMMGTLEHTIASRNYDLLVTLGDQYPEEKIERALGKTSGIIAAESWLSSGAAIASTHSSQYGESLDGFHFPVVALPADPKMITLQIVQGRGLLPQDTDAMVINDSLAGHSQIKVGDTITLRFDQEPSSWHVVGIAREPFLFPTGYIREHASALRNSIGLKLDKTDAASIYAVKVALDDNLKQEGIRAVNGLSKADWRAPYDQHYVMIFIFLLVISGMIAVVGGLGLATSMSLNVTERRRELGVLRAIGASPAVVMGIVVIEGVVVGLISWLAAAVIAGPLSRFFGNFLISFMFRSKLDFMFQLNGLWIWLVIAVVVSAISSLMPARSATKLTVREALAYE